MGAGSFTTVGGGGAHENRQPYLVLSACIALIGVYPSRP
jgi:microcystin-dependent protein